MKKRSAITSSDFIAKLGSVPKLSSAEKRAALERVLAMPNGIQKLGESFVGPTLLRLKYEGIVRNFLKEYSLGKGEEPLFDVFDYLRGEAYILNAVEGEVFIKRFEGKRVRADLFRIASFPVVPKEDLYDLKIDTLQNAQDLSKEEIKRKEDSYFLALVDTAIAGWGTNAKHTVTPNHVVTVSGANFPPEALHTACGIVASHELEATQVLYNSQDYYDLMGWGIDQIGFKAKDNIVGGKMMTEYGPLQIMKSVTVPQGTAYVFPNPEYIGLFVLRYSLDVEEWKDVPAFHTGWVMDEYVGMVINNPRGLVKLIKS